MMEDIGKAVRVVGDSWARETESKAQVMEDLGELTSFIGDCLPGESTQEIRGLLKDAIEFGVREGHQGLNQAREAPRTREFGVPEERREEFPEGFPED